MKKYLLLTVSAILWISLSSTVLAGTCTDRGYNVDAETDNICTTEYDNCRANYTTDMALPSEVPASINSSCTSAIGAVQSYDATDAAYCMEYTLMSPVSPLPDARDMEFCFAAQACIADEWQVQCNDEAESCCLGGTTTVVEPDPTPTDPAPVTPTPTPTDPSDGFTYTDNDYGFSVTLPQEWATHTLTKAVDTDVTHFSFYMRSGSDLVSLFSIGITTNGTVPAMEEYLGENSNYSFSFSHLNGDAPSDLADRVAELDGIKASFVVHNQIAQTATPAVGSVFTDTSGHQYEDAITYVKGQQIVQGYDDGTYGPDKPITRAEFMKVMMEAGFDDSVFVGSNCFSDVGGDWFAKYVCSAKDLGIIAGYADNTFKPGKEIVLAESLKIIFEAAASLSGDTILTGGEPWYQVYFDLANAVGILSTINTDPGHDLTRGEMAELIYQIDSVV